ncbi:hypothetical protein BLAT2472_130005 [Burkholderia latens]
MAKTFSAKAGGRLFAFMSSPKPLSLATTGGPTKLEGAISRIKSAVAFLNLINPVGSHSGYVPPVEVRRRRAINPSQAHHALHSSLYRAKAYHP